MITEDEWPGMLMALVIAMRTNDGESIFHTVFTGTDIEIDDEQEVPTLLDGLTPDYFVADEEEDEEADSMEDHENKQKGMPIGKWKLQKFHDQLHVASDMDKYGSPQKFT